MNDLPEVAISIMQPWAWLIVNGHKDIENRNWIAKYRGPVAIHAGIKIDHDCALSLQFQRHPVTDSEFSIDTFNTLGKGVGGIVGVAEIVDCVSDSDSDWFVGRHGFVLRNAKPVDFIPVRGALGFFRWRNNLK